LTLLKLIPEFGIVVLGIGLLMISGEIDLSVSSTIPVCAYVFSLLFMYEMNVFLIVPIVFGVGLLIGLVNGLITTKGRIPSFITTLATMMLLRGILYTHSGMFTIAMRGYLIKEPFLVQSFIGEVWGVPVQFLWFILLTLIAAVLLHFHKLGCWIYVTGDNKEAARAMGINTDLVKIICFMLVGFLCAFSAIMQIIRAHTFFVGIGAGWNLMAISGSVIGGAFLTGGVGSVPGIILGGLTISIIENGLTMLGVSYFLAWAIYGSLILSYVLFYMYLGKRLAVMGRWRG